MKHIIIFSLYFWFGLSLSIGQGFTKQEKQMYQRLKKKNFHSYENKPLSYFLNDKSVNFYTGWYFLDMKPGVLSGLVFYYGKNERITVTVYFNELRYQKQFSNTMTWDFQKLKKEKVAIVEFFAK